MNQAMSMSQLGCMNHKGYELARECKPTSRNELTSVYELTKKHELAKKYEPASGYEP